MTLCDALPPPDSFQLASAKPGRDGFRRTTHGRWCDAIVRGSHAQRERNGSVNEEGVVGGDKRRPGGDESFASDLHDEQSAK